MARKRNKPSWNKIPLLAEFACKPEELNLGGIYRISHKLNRRFYIGSAKNFETRWKAHLRELRKNEHHTPFLRNDFKVSGEHNFKFEVVEILEDDIVLRKIREQFNLDQEIEIKPKGTNYNAKKTIAGLNRPKSKIPKFRQDWDWFVDSNDVEWVIENLSQFCENYNLDFESFEKLKNKELKEYQGWKFGRKNQDNLILLNKKTQEEMQVKVDVNLTDLAKTLGFDSSSHLAKLFRGKRKSCGDWTIKNRIVVPRDPKGKNHILISPEGKEIKINNLELFCRKNNLYHAGLFRVLNGTYIEYQGWRLPGMTDEKIIEIKENKRVRLNYIINFIDPSGIEHQTNKFASFAKKHGLERHALYNLASGKILKYRGWTLGKIIPNKK